MIIRNANISDASELLKLQKLAYLSEAVIYNNYRIPPLIQTLEDVEDKFEDHIYLKVVDDGRIIGSIRGNVLDSRSVYIGRLIVHPDYQNLGIGAKLIEEIEASYPGFNRFELVTGYKSRKNIYFYQKMGYKIFKKELCPSGVYLLYLEKIIL
ncbi:MAG: GNAT family N-acetyltransferase [Methanobacterium sp.]|jgi:GNAT superfamily N-acetyltransferase